MVQWNASFFNPNIYKTRNSIMYTLMSLAIIQINTRTYEDKMIENWLLWFGHIQWRPLDALVKKSGLLTIHGNDRDRGRPKLNGQK